MAETGGGERGTAAEAAPDALRAPSGTPDVFISYASQDAVVAQAVVAALEREGLRCWIAPRDVVPGALYADEIIRAINEAKVVVLILSEAAAASEHVGREVERASSKRRRIIALRTDAASLPRAFEYFLSQSQWIDVGPGGIESPVGKLVEAVRRHLTPASAAEPSVPLAPHIRDRRVAVSRRRWVFVSLAAVVALALAFLVRENFWLPRHLTAEQQTTVATALVSDKSIAVLPFADLSEKHDQEYFADGMAEEVLDLLAKIPGLTVIGRTSSFQFKGKDVDLRTIGTQLNAAHVLEGSVRKSGDQVRVTTELINTRTGTHEWSETYERQIGDVFKLQDAIAAAVVRELQLTVAPEFLQARSAPRDRDAYDLMLRGRHAIDRYDREGADEGAMLFQQALDRDPTSADAAFWLASTYAEQGEMGFLAPATAFEKARRAITTALRLNPQSAPAHELLGEIHTIYDWDWAAADREFRQTAKLAPGSADALYGEALLSLTLGRLDEALRQIKGALAQSPMDPVTVNTLSWIQVRRGHLEEAETAARRVLDIRPTYGWAHYYLGLVLLARGNRDAALLEMQQETDDGGKQQGLAMAYYALGRRMDSDAALAGMLKDQAAGNAFGIAEVYAFRGRADDTMHWLERAYAQKDVSIYYIKGELPLRGLANDPRFKAFLRKMNLPE